MKTNLFFLVTMLFVISSCKKDEISPYHFNCKVNGQKWIAEKYEALLSDKQVLSAGANYDPSARWIQIWGDRSIVEPSQDYYSGYMQGAISMNIADFKGAGTYTFMDYPTSGFGISFLLQNWASSEVKHPDIHYPCSIGAYTSDSNNGFCTVTKFDSINQIIEGEFSFNVVHLDCDLVASISDGKFSLKYVIVKINESK